MRSYGTIARASIAGVLAFFGTGGVLLAQTGGYIRGTVIDQDGKPVQRAKVHLVGLTAKRVGLYETDFDGRFVIARVGWGTYLVCAGKEEDGYGDTMADLYSNGNRPSVTVAPATPHHEVTLRLGPKAGVLDELAIDAATGKAVESASVTLRRSADGAVRITSAKGGVLVPSLTKVFIEIHAPGYAAWFYPGYTDPSKITAIFLQPGQRIEITASLLPSGQ